MTRTTIFSPVLAFAAVFYLASILLAQDDFDKDDPTAAFAALDKIPLGKYEGEEADKMASEVLKNVEKVNKHWLFTSKEAVEKWSYTFKAQLTGGEKMEKKIEMDRSIGIWENMRGITYFGIPQSLLMGKPTFKSVEVTDKQIKLHFVCSGDNKASQRIGNGMGGQWFGFFSSTVEEGMLYVNPADFTLIGVKLPSGGMEKYTKYAALDEACKVPRRVEISHPSRGGDMTFDMNFKAYEPGLWLLDRSIYKVGKKKKSEATVVDVLVNSTAPVEIVDGADDQKAE